MATKVHELAAEVRNDPRQYAFLYVGDHDPSGLFMSEVDFPQRYTIMVLTNSYSYG
jgi:hypothetical protein